MKPEMTLLVDDEETVRTCLKRILETAGYRVLEARDGREGLQFVREFQEEICAILTDISMPGMNGVALANAVAEIAPSMPIILMSALPEQNWPEKPRCPWTFLSKPVSREALLKALRSLLCLAQPPADESERIA